MLGEHPEICMSIPKEVNYFNRHITFNTSENLNLDYDKEINWYFNHFRHARANQKLGEFTPGYALDEHARKRIKNLFPDIRLIFCLRHPVERLHSQFLRIKNYWEASESKILDAVEKYPVLLERSYYGRYLQEWYKDFDESQICIVYFEELKATPGAVIRDLYKFLEVDSQFTPPSLHQKANETSQVRWHFLRNLENKVVKYLSSRGMTKWIDRMKDASIHKLTKRLYKRPVSKEILTKEERQILLKYYKDDTKLLSELLKRNLDNWLV
jgi:hypothetical protein